MNLGSIHVLSINLLSSIAHFSLKYFASWTFIEIDRSLTHFIKVEYLEININYFVIELGEWDV